MIRILLVDDSPTACRLMRELLESDPEMRVVGEASTGVEAIELADRLAPDLVVMDVRMPEMDGLEATKEIMMRSPRPIVVVSAVGNDREIDLSLSATQAGALLALPKPPGPDAPDFDEQRRQFVAMARAMAEVKVVRRWRTTPTPTPVRVQHRAEPDAVRMVAVAASTGGPPALRRVLMDLPGDYPAPILVVQHIAPGFAQPFAEWLRGGCALHVVLAEDGVNPAPGNVYVAPDDRHLVVDDDGRLHLSSGPPVDGFRPSATLLFESAGRALKQQFVGVILTGMGSDGAAGLVAAHAEGAYVVAQDEESSVVFGMAREALRQGAVDLVVPVEKIAATLLDLTRGRGNG